jgi:Protein of unknown function (DUF4232)
MKLTRPLIAAASLAGAALLLPACALASSPGTSAPKAGTTQSRTAKAGTTKASTTKASTTKASTANASKAVHECVAGQLTDWLGVPGDAAAGSVEYPLEISNISLHTCYLFGYPGVSALKAGGHQLGSPAARIPHYTVSTITIAPGQTAHVDLLITDVDNFPPSACHPTNALALKVYAPGDFGSRIVQFPFRACAKAGPKYLRVTPVFIDTGIPGFLND